MLPEYLSMQIVLTITGSIALLVGLLGGGVKAKEIEIPKIRVGPRILTSLVGMALITMAIRLPYFTPPTNATPFPAEDLVPPGTDENLPPPPTEPASYEPASPEPTSTEPPIVPTDIPTPFPTIPPTMITVLADQSWQPSKLHLPVESTGSKLHLVQSVLHLLTCLAYFWHT